MKRDCCESGLEARTTITRRRLLQIGGLGLLGLNLPQFLVATQSPAVRRPLRVRPLSSRRRLCGQIRVQQSSRRTSLSAAR